MLGADAWYFVRSGSEKRSIARRAIITDARPGFVSITYFNPAEEVLRYRKSAVEVATDIPLCQLKRDSVPDAGPFVVLRSGKESAPVWPPQETSVVVTPRKGVAAHA